RAGSRSRDRDRKAIAEGAVGRPRGKALRADPGPARIPCALRAFHRSGLRRSAASDVEARVLQPQGPGAAPAIRQLRAGTIRGGAAKAEAPRRSQLVVAGRVLDLLPGGAAVLASRLFSAKAEHTRVPG